MKRVTYLIIAILLIASLLAGCGGAVTTTGYGFSATHTVSPTTYKVKPITPTADIVYITNTGSKYHRSGCRYLSESKIGIERAKAIREGYTACSVCKP